MPSRRTTYWLLALAAAGGLAVLAIAVARRHAPETIASLEAGLRRHPDDPALHERLGDLLVRERRAAEAVPHYQFVIKADPNKTTAACSLASVLASQGKAPEAQNVLSAALKLHPGDPAANELLAGLVIQSLGEEIALPIARGHYETALRGDPTRAAAALAISRMRQSEGDLEAAAAVLEKPLAAHPRDAALHLQMAALQAKLRQYDAANEHFNTGTALDPANAGALCDWGAMLVDAGRPVAAELVLHASIELNARSAPAHMQLGRALREQALREQGRIDDAMKEFTAAINLDPAYAPTYYECAQTVLAMHNEQAALNFLRDALTHDPGYAEALVALAKLRMTAADPNVRSEFEGLVALKQAVDATGRKDLSLLVAFARALAKAGEYDQAAEEIDLALKVRGVTPAQWEVLAQLRQQYEFQTVPKAQGPANILNVDAMVPHDPLEYSRWPAAAAPSVKSMMERPLDVTRPPAPGSALDTSIYKAEPTAPGLAWPEGIIP